MNIAPIPSPAMLPVRTVAHLPWPVAERVFVIAEIGINHNGDLALVKAVAAERKLTFMSTGMCTLAEIDAAVDIMRAADCPFILMHTVSTYPTPTAELNLMTMETLRKRYGASVGYSGHETSLEPSVMAAVLGAVAIERHITLDRGMYGSDQSASLEPGELHALVEQLRVLPTLLGDGEKRISANEAAVAKKLRYWPESEDILRIVA